MITAVIPTLNAARELHALLSALVPAAAEGLVRQVLVLDGGSSDGTHELCEDAGADVLDVPLAEAARRARGDWILALPVDLRLRRGWDAAVVAHLERGGGAALLVDATEPEGWLARLKGPSKAGVLLKRAAVEALGPGADLDALRRHAGRAPRLS
ncbi:glycosyltransferase [Phenylobacterium sp.]|uniref:glycosyltransferase n=1 Tax=Phenylobacterium sp. TaxID=1871053 RepID=UPI0035AE5C05